MSEIVAIFSRSAPTPAGAIATTTKRLHHRVPDRQRRWISPDCRQTLGHARLSIIDPPAPRNPETSSSLTGSRNALGSFVYL